VVADGQHDLVALELPGDRDLAAGRRELHCVVEQVDQELREALLVAADPRQAGREVQAKRHALAAGEQPEPIRRRARDGDQLDVGQVQGRRALLDP
jgi:hypothetical protein